jgi:toxin-antitoxin system PIN domain toxin
MRALLDTSVLIALLDANHLQHPLCTQWIATQQDGWASCPITLNGCIRILSQPQYPNRVPMQTVAKGLQEAMAHPMHRFWPDAINPLAAGALDWQRLMRPAEITDAYLLALAVHHQACLVTLDQGISLDWTHGATAANLQVLV